MDEYQATWALRGDDELAYFRGQTNLRDAIRHAGMAELANGKRHPHQYRIPLRALQQATEALLAVRIVQSFTFDQLLSKVHAAIASIPGIGELMVYDTSHRIGVYLGVEPERVYLHAGTRLGARALGLRTDRACIEPSELPLEFRALTPAQIEDCLCIFKDELGTLARRG